MLNEVLMSRLQLVEFFKHTTLSDLTYHDVAQGSQSSGSKLTDGSFHWHFPNVRPSILRRQCRLLLPACMKNLGCKIDMFSAWRVRSAVYRLNVFVTGCSLRLVEKATMLPTRVGLMATKHLEMHEMPRFCHHVFITFSIFSDLILICIYATIR